METINRLPGPFTLLKDAWKIFGSRAWSLSSIILPPLLVVYAFNALAFAGSPILKAIAALGVIAGVVFCIALPGALISTVHKAISDPSSKTTLGGAYRFGFSRFWPYLFVIVLLIPIAIGSGILLVIPYVIVVVFVAFYQFALFIDDKRGFSAFTESYSLVKGRWWAVFGRVLVMAISAGIIAAIIAGIFGAIAASVGHAADGDFVRYVIIHIGSLIISAIIGPVVTAYMYKLYMSLKASRPQGVSVSSFKNWLVAFLVIGILTMIVLILAIPALIVLVITSLSAANHNVSISGQAAGQVITY